MNHGDTEVIKWISIIVFIAALIIGSTITYLIWDPKKKIQESRFRKIHEGRRVPILTERKFKGVTYKLAVGTYKNFNRWTEYGNFDNPYPNFDFDFTFVRNGWTMSDGVIYILNANFEDYRDYIRLQYALMCEHQTLYGDRIGIQSIGIYFSGFHQDILEREYRKRYPEEWEKRKKAIEKPNDEDPVHNFIKHLN